MKFLIILASILINVYCQQYPIILTDTNCGKGTNHFSKIVGGFYVKKGDFGWTVVIRDAGVHICNGAIINSNWVITSGSCLYGRQANRLTVEYGVMDTEVWDQSSAMRNVRGFVVHQNFNPNTLKNNIAMIRVDWPVPMDTHSFKIIPICVASGLERYDGRAGYITGYGNTLPGATSSRYMLSAHLPVLTDSKCKQKFPQYNIDTNTQLCAGEQFGNVDFCENDTGSPLVVKSQTDGRWHLVGIASHGPNPCGNGGVYTRVSAFTDFIKYNLDRTY